jgi:hypothetical protein
MNKADLLLAVQAALNGDWHKAHLIAQKYNDTNANWLHAVLHKIEGDEWNSRYWYARTKDRQYEDFSESDDELIAMQSNLQE